MSSIEGEKIVTTVGISPWVYHCGYRYLYWYMRVCMGSNVRNPGLRSHMFVQSGQDGSECRWICYRLIRVWMAK